jgi:hypothetical protein
MGDSFSRWQLDERPGLLRRVIDLDLEHRKFGFTARAFLSAA